MADSKHSFDSGALCSDCKDVMFYCKCSMGEEYEATICGAFDVYSNESAAQWVPEGRRLEGSEEILGPILERLSGKVIRIGRRDRVWMDQREPLAVAYIAKELGLKLGDGAPSLRDLV